MANWTSIARRVAASFARRKVTRPETARGERGRSDEVVAGPTLPGAEKGVETREIDEEELAEA